MSAMPSSRTFDGDTMSWPLGSRRAGGWPPRSTSWSWRSELRRRSRLRHASAPHNATAPFRPCRRIAGPHASRPRPCWRVSDLAGPQRPRGRGLVRVLVVYLGGGVALAGAAGRHLAAWVGGLPRGWAKTVGNALFVDLSARQRPHGRGNPPTHAASHRSPSGRPVHAGKVGQSHPIWVYFRIRTSRPRPASPAIRQQGRFLGGPGVPGEIAPPAIRPGGQAAGPSSGGPAKGKAPTTQVGQIEHSARYGSVRVLHGGDARPFGGLEVTDVGSDEGP